MRFAALQLCLMIFTFCLVVPCGCSNKDADVAEPDSVKTEKKKDRPDTKKDVVKKTATTTKADAAKSDTKKKSDEKVALVEVPDKTKEHILNFYTSKFKLSEVQMKEADTIIMSHGAEFRELRKRTGELLTKKVRDARAEAAKKAIDSGASKSEASKAGKAAVGPAINAKLDEIDKEESELVKKVRLEIRKILTAEQLEILKKVAESNKQDAGESDGEKATKGEKK